MVGHRRRNLTALWTRQVAGWLLLCALLLRGLIPGGYMPNLDPADGRGFLVICTSIGERTVQLDGHDKDKAIQADSKQQGLCAFAMLGAWAPVLALLILLVLVLPRLVTGLGRGDTPRLRSLFCAPPGARAPPCFA